MLRALCNRYPDTWDSRIALAVWGWRVTPQPSLGNLSPYRIITGLEPRSPFSFASAPLGRRPLGVEEYVENMVEVYESTMEFVRNFKREMRNEQDEEQARSAKTGSFEVGDFVLVVRPEFIDGSNRPGRISKKLLHRVFDTV